MSLLKKFWPVSFWTTSIIVSRFKAMRSPEITPNAVEVYVSRLRAKLEPYGIALRSIRGFGYRIEQRP